MSSFIERAPSPAGATSLVFSLAGVDVRVAVAGPAGLEPLGGHYAALPKAQGCDVELSIVRQPGFSEGRARGPEYPAFAAEQTPTGLRLERFDASGTLDFGARKAGAPMVSGRFTVGESRNSTEAAIRIALSVAMPRKGAVIVHASAVADRHGAYLFAGVSGAGKSTIAELLSRDFGLEKLSDELLIVTRRGSQWGVVTAPFIGCQGLPQGRFVPLVAIHFLVQSDTDQVVPVAPGLAMAEFLRHVLVYARDVDTAGMVLNTVAALCADVPSSTLHFELHGQLPDTLGMTW